VRARYGYHVGSGAGRAGRRAIALTVLVLLVVGCAEPTLEVAAGGTEADDAADLDATPAPEATDADDPVTPSDDLVRVELPGIPAGGSSTYLEPDLQCTLVNWSGPPDLIDGVSFTVTAVSFEPAGVYALSTRTCPGAPPCLPDWIGAEACTVAVAWTGQPFDGDGELRFTGGVLTCTEAAADTCRSFGGEVAATEARGPSLLPFPDPAAPSTGEGGGSGDGDAGGSGDGDAGGSGEGDAGGSDGGGGADDEVDG
jgi:uncharacterized membrane protein YgcG